MEYGITVLAVFQDHIALVDGDLFDDQSHGIPLEPASPQKFSFVISYLFEDHTAFVVKAVGADALLDVSHPACGITESVLVIVVIAYSVVAAGLFQKPTGGITVIFLPAYLFPVPDFDFFFQKAIVVVVKKNRFAGFLPANQKSAAVEEEFCRQ